MTFKFNNTAVPVLPGRVRLNNMRTTHFSRNPKIAAFMKEYEFIREFGEGVDRMYRELEEGGWPKPLFKQDDFMLRASLSSQFASKASLEAIPSNEKDERSLSRDVTSLVTSLSQVRAAVLCKCNKSFGRIGKRAPIVKISHDIDRRHESGKIQEQCYTAYHGCWFR